MALNLKIILLGIGATLSLTPLAALAFTVTERDEVTNTAQPSTHYLPYSVHNIPTSSNDKNLDDPLYLQQWALNPDEQKAHINIEQLWNTPQETNQWENEDVIVAIIDSGVDLNHPDLEGRFWANTKELFGSPGVDDDKNGYVDDIHGYNFLKQNGDVQDEYGHGTHCAGIIAANHNNGQGVKGVFPQVKIMAIKYLDKNGKGNPDHAAKAVEYAIKNKAHIISASWSSEEKHKGLEQAIKKANEAGIIFVNAASNNGLFGKDNDISHKYPANYDIDNIIVVASHDPDGSLSSFSHYGRTTVDLAAPGRDILSTTLGGGYGKNNGTSMATPFVAGVVGLLFWHKGILSALQVKDYLMKNTTFEFGLRKKVISNGRLNALASFEDQRTPHFTPSNWIDWPLNEVFETNHPYVANAVDLKVYHVPNARFIRIVIEDLEIKDGDFLEISDFQGRTIHKLQNGVKEKIFYSDFIDGSDVIIRFQSDKYINGNGFRIEKLQYVSSSTL